MQRSIADEAARARGLLRGLADVLELAGRVPTHDESSDSHERTDELLEDLTSRAHEPCVDGHAALAHAQAVALLTRLHGSYNSSRGGHHNNNPDVRVALALNIAPSGTGVTLEGMDLNPDDADPALGQLRRNLLSSPLDGDVAALAHAIRSLADVTSKRILTTTTQAQEAAVEGRNKAARVSTAEREAAMLRDELQRQRLQRASQVTAIDAQIQSLRDEIATLVKDSQHELSTTAAAGRRQRDAALAESVHTEEHLNSGLAAARAKLDKTQRANVAAEAAARKRRARCVAEVEAAIHEYDAAVGALQGDIDAVQAEIRTDSGALDDLRAYYRRVCATGWLVV